MFWNPHVDRFNNNNNNTTMNMTMINADHHNKACCVVVTYPLHSANPNKAPGQAKKMV